MSANPRRIGKIEVTFIMPLGVSLSGNALTGYQRNIGRHQRRKAEAATVD